MSFKRCEEKLYCVNGTLLPLIDARVYTLQIAFDASRSSEISGIDPVCCLPASILRENPQQTQLRCPGIRAEKSMNATYRKTCEDETC